MAATHNLVRIDEVTKITPFPNSTTSFHLPLTYFDTFWILTPPVERLFFYEVAHLTSEIFNLTILPKLKHSLSLTLFHYLPLAGHLTWPSEAEKPAIYYSPNDGVSVTVAVSNADFNVLASDGIREAAEFRPLTPQLFISEDKAEAVAIQITLFPNEGFSIGISFHHVVADGKSSTTFMKAWAYLCKLKATEKNPCLLSPDLTPSFDRTVIKDTKGLDMVYLKSMLAAIGSDSSRSLKHDFSAGLVNQNNLVRATFKLTREDINKLRYKVLSINGNQYEVGQSKQLHLSTFVLSLSYAYVCMVKANGEEASTNVVFGFPANCRTRLDPPVPVNYFGNCVESLAMAAKASDFMTENGIAFVAEKLSDLIKGLEGDDIKGSKRKIVKLIRTYTQQPALVLSVARSTHFGLYESDFGWGRPKKVEIVSVDKTGAIAMSDCRDRDGGGVVQVGAVLDKLKMELFASLFVDGLK